jgi:acyl carrier protein
MSIPITVQQWLSDQAVPLFFIGFSLLMGVAIVYLSAQNRRSSLVRDRSGRSEDTFVDDLYVCGYDPDIARTAYRYLQEHQDLAFPIEPLDDLDHDLGLDSEDVNQTIRELLDEVDREHLPGLLYSPLVTVLDLVRYIQASPRRDKRAGLRIA